MAGNQYEAARRMDMSLMNISVLGGILFIALGVSWIVYDVTIKRRAKRNLTIKTK